jgi:hypothetical protein
MPEQLLAASAVAALLGHKPRTIDNWKYLEDPNDPRRKLLPVYKVGSRNRYRQSDVDNYIRSLSVKKVAPRKPTDKPERKTKPRRVRHGKR